MLSWILLRTLSYGQNICDTDPERKSSMTHQGMRLFAYCLHVPFLAKGPFMKFPDWSKYLDEPYQPITMRRILEALIQAVRFTFWVIVLHWIQYTFFGHAFNRSPHLVKKLDPASAIGLMFYHGVQFNIKYVVLYGIGGAFAALEGFTAPPPPQCVLLMDRSSAVWRRFDRGLQSFKIQCIFKPVLRRCGNSEGSRVFASACVF